jgi:hypothetical protein
LLLVLVIIAVIIMGFIDLQVINHRAISSDKEQSVQPEIDLVASWAGQDTPARVSERADFNLQPRRYRDNGELQKLLYSVDKFASDLIRDIFIVLPDNSAQPEWLTQNPRVKLVPESVILAHLPTFNSQSIETVLDRIPGLSPHFFYVCDDMLFTAPAGRLVHPGRAIHYPRRGQHPYTEFFPKCSLQILAQQPQATKQNLA